MFPNIAQSRQSRAPRGFTLMESLMAAGILLAIVVAVTSAITAGQQHAFEARQRIAATLAAEELMGRLMILPYDNLPAWNGHTEPVGALTDMGGNPFPDTFDSIGRDVNVTTSLRTVPDIPVNVRGRSLRIRAFDASDRTLVELTRFIPEPQS